MANGFTANQRRALANSSQAARAGMRKLFSTQNGRGRNGNGGRQRFRGMRTRGSSVLAPGAAAVPPRAYGGLVGNDLRCWDAKLPSHLPLPRAVGPYTVIRTTRRLSINHTNVVFGTMRAQGAEWSNAFCWSSVSGIVNVGAANNSNLYIQPMAALGTALTLVPAALTVQIMNPEALQTTQGMIYAGVMNTQAKGGGRTETWDDWFDKFVEFQSPRILAAAKLALRGVQINSFPLSMSQLSEFTTLNETSDTLGTSWNSNSVQPDGLAPIMVYNPNGVGLEYLVTIEWRVRFDLTNPASAGHTHHPVSSDFTWDKLMRQAVAFGNGVMDIADTVANIGQVATSVGARIRPALTNTAPLLMIE